MAGRHNRYFTTRYHRGCRRRRDDQWFAVRDMAVRGRLACGLREVRQAKLIALGERSAELFYNTGLLLQKSGLFEDAVKHYRQALSEKPDIAEALLNLGHALKALGQDDEARTCWRKALESNPELASSYFAT